MYFHALIRIQQHLNVRCVLLTIKDSESKHTYSRAEYCVHSESHNVLIISTS